MPLIKAELASIYSKTLRFSNFPDQDSRCLDKDVKLLYDLLARLNEGRSGFPFALGRKW
jgi:hypothetical protein